MEFYDNCVCDDFISMDINYHYIDILDALNSIELCDVWTLTEENAMKW